MYVNEYVCTRLVCVSTVINRIEKIVCLFVSLMADTYERQPGPEERFCGVDQCPSQAINCMWCYH